MRHEYPQVGNELPVARTKKIMSGDSFHERMIELVSDPEFLYSFFLGLLPSLMDIGTDFSFAERC